MTTYAKRREDEETNKREGKRERKREEEVVVVEFDSKPASFSSSFSFPSSSPSLVALSPALRKNIRVVIVLPPFPCPPSSSTRTGSTPVSAEDIDTLQ